MSEDLMPDKAAWFSKRAVPHTIWAFLLTWYVIVLVVSAGTLITTPPDPKKVLSPPAQTVCCDCIRPKTCAATGSAATPATGAKPAIPPSQELGVKQSRKP